MKQSSIVEATGSGLKWKRILEFQDRFYPTWRTNDKPILLFSTALAGEVGEVCGVVTHIEGGGTNGRKYTKDMVLHQCVDSYVQLVLLLAKYGFTAYDFDTEFWRVMEELNDRCTAWEQRRPNSVDPVIWGKQCFVSRTSTEEQ